MQGTTRFSKVEDVILIEENFTPEYKEIQSWLKSYFSYSKFKSDKHGLFNSDTFDCLSFEDINRTEKDRFKYQISPIRRGQETNKALVIAFDKPYFIQKINENSFDCYTTNPNTSYSEDGAKLWDIGTFDLKYSEYEIVYCIINKLAKYRLFDDKEEFETVYNFCKALFDGTEKDFLTCLIHPYKFDSYIPYPNDYNKIEHYSDLKTCLIKIKSGLLNKPAPHATEQPTNTKEFDNTTLTQIMNDDMIDLFLKNEKRLKADGYIDSENKWINGRGKNQTKSLKDLANLILLLKEKNYLKPKFEKKQWKDNDYRKFFEVRYGCNLKDQFLEANAIPEKSLETAKTTFIWF